MTRSVIICEFVRM